MCLAVPGEIKEITGGKALVDVDGFCEEVILAAVRNVSPGDFVLIHAGCAVEKISRRRAEAALAELKQIFAGLDEV
jgi:hydrogenase expression/formation protein HypC